MVFYLPALYGAPVISPFRSFFVSSRHGFALCSVVHDGYVNPEGIRSRMLDPMRPRLSRLILYSIYPFKLRTISLRSLTLFFFFDVDR